MKSIFILQKFQFNNKNEDYDRKLTLIVSDVIENMKDTIEYFFKNISEKALVHDSLQSYNSPDEKFMYPFCIISKSGDLITTTETQMKSMNELGSTSKYAYFKEKEVTKLIDRRKVDTTPIIVESNYYRYDFTTVNDFGGNSDIEDAYGKNILRLYKYTIRPDDDTDTLFKEVTELLHIPFQVQHIPMYSETKVNYFMSDTLTRWLRNRMFDTTAIIRNSSQYGKTYFVPPVYSLVKSVIVYDNNDTILSGIINNYDTVFSTSSNPNNRIGAILSDTIVGYGGEKQFKAKYEYTGGWYKNFLKTQENLLGVKNRLYYQYSDIEALGNQYPQGIKLHNDNVMQQQKLFKEFYQYESPIASDVYIRKYKQIWAFC